MTVITKLPPDPAIAAPPDFAAFDNSYARLPERFYARLPPTPVAQPALVKLNRPLAAQLGLDPERLASPEGVAVLAGNRIPEGADPIAMAYAGHQFGNFVPQLGDGRAILLGEVVDRAGLRHDLQLKGSGPTPFSRRGDGRAVLGPVLREYIVSEAMAAFGIPTTRSLAAVLTGEKIWRDSEELGAVLTRVARSHVRVGTFELFAARRDTEALRTLADYVIARLYPELAAHAKPYRALLDTVIARIAALIAGWQGVGFIHGVMNTDNMSIAGETIDYGPCAFMDVYHPGTVFSSIDQAGRYAWGNQPYIAHWNLVQFAQALLPLIAEDRDAAIAEAQQAIDAFPALFEAAWTDELRRKLGLFDEEPGDLALAQDLLKRMEDNGADFTLTFRRLADAASPRAHDEPVRMLFAEPTHFDAWAVKWHERLARDPVGPDARRDAMRDMNPLFIPRNHRVEYALIAANQGDLSKLDELLTALATPFDDQPERAHLAAPPQPHEIVRQTFCGT